MRMHEYILVTRTNKIVLQKEREKKMLDVTTHSTSDLYFFFLFV